MTLLHVMQWLVTSVRGYVLAKILYANILLEIKLLLLIVDVCEKIKYYSVIFLFPFIIMHTVESFHDI